MAENNNAELEVQDDSIEETPAEDKTSEKNEKDENTLDDLPSEDGDLDLEGKDKKQPDKVDRAEIAQKIKWREKARKLETDVERLTAELAESKQRVVDKGGEIDEKEKAAQEYIRSQAKKVFEELRNLEKKEEERVVQKFETEVDAVLEDNPNLTESDLLDTVEEFEVDPKVAAKILLRQQGKSKPKPKMPTPKRATASPEEKKTEEKKPGERKGFWQLNQEIKKGMKKFGL